MKPPSDSASRIAGGSFLAGRALLRRLLEQEVGWSRQICEIAYDANGRPAVFARNRSYGIDASITHSRDRVACAITVLGQLGIDIELRATERAANRIAAVFFDPWEQRIVATDGNAAFYRLWTLREAMVKALGKGMRSGMYMAAVSGRSRRKASGGAD